MILETIVQRLTSFVAENANNAIQSSYAIDQSLVGIRYYDAPLVAVADADDPIFSQFQSDPAIIGSTFRLPEQWLSGAKSVVSFFLPFTKEFIESAKGVKEGPSETWAHGRAEGQKFLIDALEEIADWLRERGYDAIIPAVEPDLKNDVNPNRVPLGQPMVASSWSERHVAFAAGLGTFSLTTSLITKKGVCGRFGSIITTAPLEVTPRPYTEPYEYCTFCGACTYRCPIKAISLEKRKDMVACASFAGKIKADYAPLHGCGKCQINLPCSTQIPKKINKK